MSVSNSYGGFYTRQEQEDALAARIDNPNRIGSGFINLGPQERNVQPATNWQTASLLGGPPAAPPMVSDIWASSTPPPPPSQRLPTQQPQPQAPPFPPGGQPFSAPTPTQAPPRDVSALFGSLSLDATAKPPQIPQQNMPPPHIPPPQYMGGAGASGYAGLGVTPPFMGAGGAGAPPQPSLMTLLAQQPPAPPPSAPVGYGPLGNGAVPPAHRMGYPPAQLPLSAPLASHSGFPSASTFPPSSSNRGPPPPRAPPPVGKTLQSAADYAAAAVSYKPPPPPSRERGVALGRKPELSKSEGSPAPPAEKEWECPRCTFLNNNSLYECEMCAFERPGKAAVLGPSGARGGSEEEVWKSAGGGAARKAAPVAGAVAASGKSKAQSKNEKRRAKKRGD